ncbi:MAG: hypothetical protein ABR929_09860 [Roseiarcus sp.]
MRTPFDGQEVDGAAIAARHSAPRFQPIFAGDSHSAGDMRDPAVHRAFRGRDSEPGALSCKRGLA